MRYIHTIINGICFFSNSKMFVCRNKYIIPKENIPQNCITYEIGFASIIIPYFMIFINSFAKKIIEIDTFSIYLINFSEKLYLSDVKSIKIIGLENL